MYVGRTSATLGMKRMSRSPDKSFWSKIVQNGNNSRKSLVFISFPSLQSSSMIEVIVFNPKRMDASIDVCQQLGAPMRGGTRNKLPLWAEVDSEEEIPANGGLSIKHCAEISFAKKPCASLMACRT